MARQSATLRRHVAVLLSCLHELSRCALAKLCLLNAQLTEALAGTHLLLRQVAIKTRCCLTQLRLLRGLLAYLSARLHAQACLLCGQLSSLLLQPGLLCRNLCLLRAQLANALARLHLTALLLFKRCHGLRLRLAVALRQKIGNCGGLLIHQVALHFSTLNTFTLTAKRTGPYRLRRQTLAGNRGLAVHLPHRLVDDLLTVRVHKGLSRGRVVALCSACDRSNACLKRALGHAKAWLASSLRGHAHSLLTLAKALTD